MITFSLPFSLHGAQSSPAGDILSPTLTFIPQFHRQKKGGPGIWVSEMETCRKTYLSVQIKPYMEWQTITCSAEVENSIFSLSSVMFESYLNNSILVHSNQFLVRITLHVWIPSLRAQMFNLVIAFANIIQLCCSIVFRININEILIVFYESKPRKT
jgi:hypothetical protein